MRSSKGEHGPVLIDFLLHINADISNRVMTVLAGMLPNIDVYSIDEAWGDLTGVQEDLSDYGRRIRTRLQEWVGMPVGVGISSTKTLAKLANWAAKRWPATGGVVDLTDPARQEKLLRLAAVQEVWGIGRRLSAKLNAMGIKTAWDLAHFDLATLRQTFGVTLERTARELRGESCIGLSEGPPPKQAICSSKMFGHKLHELAPIQEALASYVTRAAEKLRFQGSRCGALQVSLQTQVHNPALPRYANSITCALTTPSDDTRDLLAASLRGLKQLYRPGYAYSKCAVLLLDLSRPGKITQDLFAPPPRHGSERLMAVLDAINQREGRGTLRLGRIPAQPEWRMRRDMLSRCYTTRWDELMAVRG